MSHRLRLRSGDGFGAGGRPGMIADGPGPDDRPRAAGGVCGGDLSAAPVRPGGMWPARLDLASGSLRVPGVAAAVEGGAVGLAPDGVGDPGRADGDPEVVAVGEGVSGGALIRRAGAEV